MSLFRANIQQQTQPTGGGLFSGSSNSIFGSSNNNPNTNNKGLFGNLFTNTSNQNTNNQQTNDKQTPSLFSNNPIGTNGLFGFNNNNNNQTTTNNNNTNDKGLFSGINPNNSNNIFGNFQNNKTSNDNNNKPIIPSSSSLFGTLTNNTQSVQNSQANNEQKNKKDENFYKIKK